MPNSTQFSGPAANPMPARSPRTPLVIPARAAERAATRYVVDDAGCHVSTYSVGSHGYAQVGWHAKGEDRIRATTAHRAAWVYANGSQIPDGMTIDHTCKNTRCVNPNHLRLLTNYENARRTHGRDWPIGECAHGHPNSLIVEVEGRFHCGECHRRWQAKKRKAAPVASKPRPKRTTPKAPKPQRAQAKPSPQPKQPATHCHRGHEYTAENVYRTPAGERWCRTCMRAREANRPKRKRITDTSGKWRWETHQEARERLKDPQLVYP